MKYNKIMLFFNIALAASTLMRFFQIKYTIDFETGFFNKNYEGVGYFILAAIFLAALICAFFSLNYYKRPEHPPAKSILLGVVSFFPAISIILEISGENTLLNVIPMQNLLLKISGVLAAAFFVLYGLNKFLDFVLPDIASIVPCVYIIIRIIIDFASISSLALITDYIFLISSYCVMLLFFLNFTKLYNNMDTDRNFKKLLASGLASSVLCISQSVTYFVINAISANTYKHISTFSNLSLLTLGLFIMVFVFSHFSEKNAE